MEDVGTVRTLDNAWDKGLSYARWEGGGELMVVSVFSNNLRNASALAGSFVRC